MAISPLQSCCLKTAGGGENETLKCCSFYLFFFSAGAGYSHLTMNINVSLVAPTKLDFIISGLFCLRNANDDLLFARQFKQS